MGDGMGAALAGLRHRYCCFFPGLPRGFTAISSSVGKRRAGMDKILRIDMGAEGGPKARTEPVGEFAGLGGRAMTTAIVSKEVHPLCHPLGAENKLVIAPGSLSGTAAAMSGRISVGCKSPLTGGIKESNAGGQAAQVLARLGYAAIVLEGKPEGDDLHKIFITKDGVEVSVDNSLKNLPNYPLIEKLKGQYSNRAAYMTIGTAGEMKLLASSIACTDPEKRPTRHCGRGGTGAVMGSKRVKAIILDDTGLKMRPPKDPEKFREANRRFVEGLRKHPITGEGQAELEVKRGGLATHGCHRGCVIQCSGVYVDKDGTYVTKQPEYETVWAHGGNCGIDDLDVIARLDYLDDNFGVDTMDTGAAVGVAMEAGLIPFGDGAGAIRLVEEIGKGTPLGRILGCGAEVTGKVFGVERVPVVKGQAMAAYDPRSVMGIGVTYATTTQGADHTAGYSVGPNVLKSGGDLDPLKPEGQVEMSRNLQIATAAVDSTGMCLFIAFPLLDQPETFQALLDMIGAFHGVTTTGDDVTALGRSILKMERDFNTRAGFTKHHDRLPRFFLKEPIPPHNVTFQVTDEDLDKVFNW